MTAPGWTPCWTGSRPGLPYTPLADTGYAGEAVVEKLRNRGIEPLNVKLECTLLTLAWNCKRIAKLRV